MHWRLIAVPTQEFIFWALAEMFDSLCSLNIHHARESYAEAWMDKPSQEKSFQPPVPPCR